MKSLIETVKRMSVKSKINGNAITFLDNTHADPGCQRIIEKMSTMSLPQLGISGPDDPYHFQKNLNRITIEGSDDYRLVLFFIRKGTRMPLHDHPNMCVFFRMMFGRLSYKSYDKVDEKFRYNKVSFDEYQELLAKKKCISAKLSMQTVLSGPQFMMVKPSKNNLHEFVAEENTCFFDICLPNYTADSLRRITYFKEIETDAAVPDLEKLGPLADSTRDLSTRIDGLRFL
jgi:cysteamine dioxygenase